MIDLGKFTDRQLLTIEKGLCDYKYIMDHWADNDKDFKDVYYNFYLRSRWAIMQKDGNLIPYFNKLQSVSPNDDLLCIVKDLQNDMVSHYYEFSLATKLLHTRNPQKPIYDSKIREYLKNQMHLDLWLYYKSMLNRSKLDLISHDWILINNWYDNFLSSDIGKEWIEWFDKNFPYHTTISNIKKIDFIIITAT